MSTQNVTQEVTQLNSDTPKVIDTPKVVDTPKGNVSNALQKATKAKVTPKVTPKAKAKAKAISNVSDTPNVPLLPFDKAFALYCLNATPKQLTIAMNAFRKCLVIRDKGMQGNVAKANAMLAKAWQCEPSNVYQIAKGTHRNIALTLPNDVQKAMSIVLSSSDSAGAFVEALHKHMTPIIGPFVLSLSPSEKGYTMGKPPRSKGQSMRVALNVPTPFVVDKVYLVKGKAKKDITPNVPITSPHACGQFIAKYTWDNLATPSNAKRKAKGLNCPIVSYNPITKQSNGMKVERWLDKEKGILLGKYQGNDYHVHLALPKK